MPLIVRFWSHYVGCCQFSLVYELRCRNSELVLTAFAAWRRRFRWSGWPGFWSAALTQP